MTKRQLIDEIVVINRSAEPAFLARFQEDDLDEYLRHLRLARTPRLSGDPHRFDHYFDNCPTIPATEPAVTASIEELAEELSQCDEMDNEQNAPESLPLEPTEATKDTEIYLAQPVAEIESSDELQPQAEPAEEFSLQVQDAVEEAPAAYGRPQWRADRAEEPTLAFDPHVDPAASFAQSYGDEQNDAEESVPAEAVAAPVSETIEEEEEQQAYLF